MAEAIAPPRDAGLVPLNPAVNVKMPPVAGVTVTTPVTVTDAPAATPNVTAADMPPRAQQIIAGVASADPRQKLEAVKLMNQQDADTADLHENVQPQWGKMLISALQGNYSDAYKYYNGGATRSEEAYDVNGNKYWKQYNEIGATGVVKRDADKKILSSAEITKLNERGGIISPTDTNVMQTAPWINGKTNLTLTNNALITPLARATNDAYNAANLAGSANKNADEQIEILQTNPGVQKILDHISKLPAEKRQKILGLVNQFKTISGNTGTTTEKRGGATGGIQNTGTNTSNIGGSASGGVGGQTVDGAVAPGAQVGGKAGISASDTSMVQGGVSVGQGVGTSTSNANTLQEQQNVRTLIEKELQSVTSSADFDKYMRIQALDAQNKAASSAIPTHVMPPGYTNVTESDLQLGGTKAVIANRVEQLKNNALMAAWSNELYKATREAAKTGALIDINAVANQFQQSDMFKAINNTYAHRMSLELGQPSTLKSGDLVVDPKTHRIFKK
jgi:hypothetical protein